MVGKEMMMMRAKRDTMEHVKTCILEGGCGLISAMVSSYKYKRDGKVCIKLKRVLLSYT